MIVIKSIAIFNKEIWTAELNEFGEFVIHNGKHSKGLLQRGGDDRKCWVVTGVIHKCV
jgi:hypothetical protein